MASEVLAFKDALAQRVNALSALERPTAMGTIELKAEVELYERALDRSGKFLDMLAEHNFGPFPFWWIVRLFVSSPNGGNSIMGSTRRRFTDEYKANAVELVLGDGRTIVEVARNIGVHEMTLGKWVKKARDQSNTTDRPLNESEREELERLREEVTRVRMEAEFAKKVATWFAKDQR